MGRGPAIASGIPAWILDAGKSIFAEATYQGIRTKIDDCWCYHIDFYWIFIIIVGVYTSCINWLICINNNIFLKIKIQSMVDLLVGYYYLLVYRTCWAI